MAKRTKKVGITGKYRTCSGAPLRKMVKTEINQGVLSYLLDETIKIINFIKFWSQVNGIKNLNIVRDKRGNTHRGLLFHTKVQGLSWGKALVQLFELQAELVTFLKECHFHLKERLTCKLWLIRHSQKQMKLASHFKENNWQDLLCMKKVLSFQVKTKSLGNVYTCYSKLDNCPKSLKRFLWWYQ